MVNIFCRLLDFPSVSLNYKLQLFLPAKHPYAVELTHLQNSTTNGLIRKPLHLTLFSKPLSPEVDVISRHENPDGSLVFRFGDPSEVEKDIQAEESKTVEEEKGKGAEDGYTLLKQIASEADRKLTGTNVIDSTEPTVISSEGVKFVGGEDGSSNNVVEGGSSDAEWTNEEIEPTSCPSAEMEQIGESEEGLSEDSSTEDAPLVDKSFQMENTVITADLENEIAEELASDSLKSVADDDKQLNQDPAFPIDAPGDPENQNTETGIRSEIVQDAGESIQVSHSDKPKPVESFSEEIVDQKLHSEMPNVIVEAHPLLEKVPENLPVDSEAQTSPQFQVEPEVTRETTTITTPLEKAPENLPVDAEAQASPQFQVEPEVARETMTITAPLEKAPENLPIDAEAQASPQFQVEPEVTRETTTITAPLEKAPENLPVDAEAQASPQFQVESEVSKETSTISVEQLKEENGASSIEMALGDKPQFIDPEEERLERYENYSGDFLETSQPRAELFAVVLKKELALSSGAAMLPHPSKVLAGGSDANFIADETWLGIADGVGEWSLKGNNEGIYAQELMKTCERLISRGNDDSVDGPLELLSRSVHETHSHGSSTVLISQFDGQSLHVANVGDSGFIVLRHGAVYKKSFPMNHLFHFPLHVQMGDDPSSIAETYRVDLLEDDVIITATDGLLDNLYDQEIALIVSNSLEQDKDLQEVAELLATKAQQIGRSVLCRSPFADDAHAAGYGGCIGGKLDGVVVIVSRVVQRRSDS